MPASPTAGAMMSQWLISSIFRHLGDEVGGQDVEKLLHDELSEDRRQEFSTRIMRIGRNEHVDWSPPQPSSTDVVWRYLNFTQLLSIIERDEIWLSNVGSFDDPYEGSIPKPNLISEIHSISEEFDIPERVIFVLYQRVQQIRDTTQDSSFVNCWNVNEHQSAALWEQYIDAGEGVAIRTTVSQLKDAVEPANKDFTFGNIEYIDYEKEEIPTGHIPTIYHKRESFEHEHEFRISYVSNDDDERSDPGFYAKVDKDVLIDSVVISPTAPGWFSDLVEKVLQRYEVDCDITESGLYSDPDLDITFTR